MKKRSFSNLHSPISIPSGFTLLELLVVFALIATITSLGFAAFSTYNSSQVVQSSTSDVVTLLSVAKDRSLSQVKPSVCGTNPLQGYRLDVSVGGQSYKLSVVCGSTYQIISQTLPPQVKFMAGTSPSTFFIVSSGTVAAPTVIILNGYGKTKTITVNSTGNISTN